MTSRSLFLIFATLSLCVAAHAHAQNKPAASGSVVDKRLQACKNEAGMNLIKREQCVWSLCKGRWGKDSCPDGAKIPLR